MQKSDRIFSNIVDKNTIAYLWSFAKEDWAPFIEACTIPDAEAKLKDALSKFPILDKGIKPSHFTNDLMAVLPKSFIVANAAESFPGHWKDNILTEYEPHKVLMGVALVCLATRSHHGCVVVHGNAKKSYESLRKARKLAYEKGLIGPQSSSAITISIRRSSGLLSCAEDTALLAHLEGKRPLPENNRKLFRKTAFVRNVETFASLGGLLKKGYKWWKDKGVEPCVGTKIFSISGRVSNPTVFEEEYGAGMIACIENYAGGVQNSWSDVLCIFPGGIFSQPLSAQFFQKAFLDEGCLKKLGSSLAGGSLIVLEKKDSLSDFVHKSLMAYQQESCGMCPSCHGGISYVRDQINDDAPEKEIRKNIDFIENNALCSHGVFAAQLARSFLHKKWRGL
ncbi:MAG: hypothetical protein OXC30_01705 [Alphaproteobacteria bacterium]|nr:hypothetical protein [Alphaproteobacteria bacterium]